jgi:hypothetical protein
MFTRKQIALSIAKIGRALPAQIGKRSDLPLAAAVCGLLILGSAQGDDGTGVMRITAGETTSTPPAAAPAPEAAPVGRVGLGHGETCDCDASASCSGGHSCCGIWHTCLCGGADHGYGYRFLDWNGYTLTYPVNPWYYDVRDTRVYAAAGFGAPMTVPLAPTVQTQVNYSWGIPASRITPISRVAPQPGAMMGAMAPLPYSYGNQGAPVPPVMPNALPSR